MAAIEIVGTVLHVLSLGVVVGGYIALVWSPFLLIARLRPLFQLGLTNEWWTNYMIAAVIVGTVHATVYVTGTVLIGGSTSPAALLFYSGIGVGLLGMATAGILLPMLGYEWADADDGFVTALSLLAGSLWYAAITIVPPFVLWTMYLARS